MIYFFHGRNPFLFFSSDGVAMLVGSEGGGSIRFENRVQSITVSLSRRGEMNLMA